MIGWVIETLVASTLLMGLVLLLRDRVAAAFGPRVAYLLWLLPLARMVLPRLPKTAHAPVSLPIDIDLPAIDAPADAGTALAQMLAAQPEPGIFDWLAGHWVMVVFMIWLGGALLHFCWQMGLYRRFLSAALRGSALLCRTCGIAIHCGPHVGGPAAVGILRRRILLPADFTTRYDPAERRLVLAHEVAHHVRGDLIANAAALAILSLHWFNPLAYRAYRAFRVDQELACDATVLADEAPEATPVYGAALVKSVHAATPAAACAIGSAAMLKRRLKMMAKPNRSRLRRIGGGLIAGATIAGGLALTASGSVAAPSRLPGFRQAVMQMDGAPFSFDHDNGSSMHAAASVGDAPAAPALPARPAKPAAVPPNPIRLADARRTNAPKLRVRSDADGLAAPVAPIPPVAPVPPVPAVASVPPIPPIPPVTVDFAEAGKAARIAAAQARAARHAAAMAERVAELAAAEQERAEGRAEAARARAEAARARAERSAAEVRSAIDAAHVRETVTAALAQARVQMATNCRYARPAIGPETDRQAIARLSAGCVDQAAIRTQISTALQKAREGLRNAQDMDERSRERALNAMDRAIERMEARNMD
ncbi:M56 family metallopeptidase [Sphingomonas sp. MMS24-J13]|uniref:M56 family metallopeptidase n=1 Tax=Sphingomonas sp. MMS24-J13 TaxID=3238686 RepID=UPI00384A57E6